MDSEACGIVTTMVLGDKDLLDSRVKQLYQVGGISHILAISGLHISVIGMTLYRFLRKRGLGYASAGILAGGIVCAYGTMVGMGTSVRRSVVMFLLLLAAQAIGRTYDTPSALGVAALLLLWDNPFLLWDAGFLFSFTAIIGVVWVGRSVRFGEDWSGKCLEKIFGAAAVYLATLPLAAWYYYEIPVYAVLLNLLVLPMMGVLLCLALMGGILGMWFQHLAEIILFPCGKLLELCNLLCQICAELPGAMLITGRPENVADACLLYAARGIDSAGTPQGARAFHGEDRHGGRGRMCVLVPDARRDGCARPACRGGSARGVVRSSTRGI